MQGVLLAGGNGGRLRPLTSDTAKVMVKVADRPMIEYCLDHLCDTKVNEIIIVVGYRGEQIVNHIGDNYNGTPVKYVDQEQQLGTAHALLKTRKYISEDFILMYPDNVYGSEFELNKLISTFESSSESATILINKVDLESARKSGVVHLDDKGEIKDIEEKPSNPSSKWTLCGTFIFSPIILDYCEKITLSDRGEYELTDALNILLESGQDIGTMELEGWVMNINTPEDRDQAEARLKN